MPELAVSQDLYVAGAVIAARIHDALLAGEEPLRVALQDELDLILDGHRPPIAPRLKEELARRITPRLIAIAIEALEEVELRAELRAAGSPR
jgi:hypothetical protein